ncbi:MAG: FtsX-like permease family protein [Acidobacteriota bacterium]
MRAALGARRGRLVEPVEAEQEQAGADQVDPGYRGDRVLAAEVFGNFTKYPDAQSLRRLYVSILERLETAPGVMAAAVTNGVPLDGLQPGQTRFLVRGRADDTPDLAPTADVRIASPRYFETIGVPVVRGRAFSELDHEDAPPVVVINESMVRYWEGQDPIGTEVSTDDGRSWATVVGVVGDVRAFGLDREAVGQIYRPLRQAGGLAGRVLVRMNGEPAAAAAIIREAVRSVDPDIPIENVRTLDEIRERFLATPKLTALLLAAFAGLALLVTVTGITGVVATSVSQRTQEFGVRMALGAGRESVLAMVLRQGLGLVALGLVLGVGASLALARVLQSYLYATAPTDPMTFAAVSGAFLLAGLLACVGPAWRATTVDPMLALRAE